jgi:pyridoxamine 5'-phosphate oxidase-like protein
MATWTEFAEESPDLAALAERRLVATELMMLGTLRADGYPRISPVEPVVDEGKLVVHDGYLYFGSMGGSTKALDLRRDPRCSLHTATADKSVSEGDVKFWGLGKELVDDAELERFADETERRMGWRPATGKFHVFLVDLLGVSSVRVKGDVMVVTTWKPGGGTQVVEKRE